MTWEGVTCVLSLRLQASNVQSPVVVDKEECHFVIEFVVKDGVCVQLQKYLAVAPSHARRHRHSQ